MTGGESEVGSWVGAGVEEWNTDKQLAMREQRKAIISFESLPPHKNNKNYGGETHPR